VEANQSKSASKNGFWYFFQTKSDKEKPYMKHTCFVVDNFFIWSYLNPTNSV
jgi:hypothetical protein